MRLLKAYIWKTFKDFKAGNFFWIFVSLIVILSIFTIITSQLPFTSTTEAALRYQAENYLKFEVITKKTLEITFIIIQLPYLITIFSSIMISTFVLGSVGYERGKGILELLLTTEFDLKDIILTILITSFMVSILIWTVLFSAGYFFAFIGSRILLHISFSIPTDYLQLILLFSPLISLLAGILAVYLSMFIDIEYRGGISSPKNFIAIIPLLPALLSFLYMSIKPEVSPIALTKYVLLIASVLLIILLFTVPKIITVEKFIGIRR